MSKIFDQLYLGSVADATNPQFLKDAGITHIVNCAEECPSPFSQTISYLNLNLKDIPTQSLYHVFEPSFEYIRDNIGMGSIVLVHCAAGISRSTSIVLYFIMKIKNVGYDQAIAFVRSKRSIVNPNIGFKQQLISVSPDVIGYLSTYQSHNPTETKYGTRQI